MYLFSLIFQLKVGYLSAYWTKKGGHEPSRENKLCPSLTVTASHRLRKYMKSPLNKQGVGLFYKQGVSVFYEYIYK